MSHDKSVTKVVPVNGFERTRLTIKDAWVGVGGVIRLNMCV